MTAGTWQAIRLTATKRPAEGTVIAEASGPGGQCPPAILALWQPGAVVIAWTDSHRPIRRLAPASLATLRRKRLRRRLDRQCPLFAPQLFDAELAARPGYYAGERQP